MAGYVRMMEIESILAVRVGIIDPRYERALALVLGIEWSSGNRRVEHELVKIGFVRYGVVDHLIDIFRSVRFQPDNARSENPDPVGVEVEHELVRVHVPELGIGAVLAFQTHPNPRNAQPDQFIHGIRLDRAGRGEYIQGPGFPVLLHQPE